MSLTKQEVSRGAVAYLDGDALLKDPLIANGDHGHIGMRPFVCLSTNGNDAVWMLLTTQSSDKRLLLDQWKVPGSEKWMSEAQYLHDARKSFSGPVDIFVASSKKEIPHYPHQRPRISEEGMLAIEREMAKYPRKR